MLPNYLKTAIRNLRKSKGFSAINIVGLAIGLATCLLILIFVTDELNYDRYNDKADRIYRVDGEIKLEAIILYWRWPLLRPARRCCGIIPKLRRKYGSGWKEGGW
jgi:hypothetical protein